MKSDLLLRIKAAEDEAAKRVEKAESEAKRITADARRQAEEIIVKGRAIVDETIAAQTEVLRAELQEQERKRLREGGKEAERMRERFSGSLEGATDRVLALFEERYV